MNNSLTLEPETRTICVQPGCLFKNTGFKAQHLTEFLVQRLTGESLESVTPEFEQILSRPQCTPCALRVMQGGKACLTEAEWSHLDEVGQWHQRRQRRSKRWGYQPH
jgi:hypothetical protein